MTTPVVSFFNNNGGVGKTTLVYHLAWMASELGVSVLAVDLDPQANLTAACLDANVVEKLWDGARQTVYGAIAPLVEGVGDLSSVDVQAVSPAAQPSGGGFEASESGARVRSAMAKLPRWERSSFPSRKRSLESYSSRRTRGFSRGGSR